MLNNVLGRFREKLKEFDEINARVYCETRRKKILYITPYFSS